MVQSNLQQSQRDAGKQIAKSRPNDGGDFNYVPPGLKAANDNHSDLTKTGPSFQPIDEKGQVNNSNVIRGAFGQNVQQAGSQNDPSLRDGAAANVSRNFAEQNFAQAGTKKIGPTDNDYLSISAANDSQENQEEDFANPEEQSAYDKTMSDQENAWLQQQAQATEQEENLRRAQESQNQKEEEVKNHKVNFPWIIMCICFVEWLGSLVLNLIAFVLGIIIFPIGMALGTMLFFWKIAFSTFIYAWVTAYEKKEFLNFKKTFSKSKRIANLVPKKKVGFKIFFGLINIIPIIDWLPTNIFMIIRLHRQLKKELK